MDGVRPRHLLVLTYWRYEDALIQTYTLPYVRLMLAVLPAGSSIHLVTLEREADAGPTQEVEPGVLNVRLRLFPFGVRATVEWAKNTAVLLALIVRHGMDGIHAWCTPAGAIGLVLSRLTRVPLVVDSYEPHAESMVENGAWQRSGVAFRLLFELERQMSHHARALIAAAPGMRDYAEEKYDLRRGDLPVKPACVDLMRFHPARRKNAVLQRELDLVDKIVCVYAGKFGGIYLEREVFDLLSAAFERWGFQFRAVLLTSHAPETVARWAADAGLPPECVVVRFVRHADIPDYLGLGDFALTPVKPVASKRACSPIKDGEYWALGLPVIITPDISEDSELIERHGCGVIWRDFSVDGCRSAIAKMSALLDGSRAELMAKNRALATTHRNFDIARRIYADLYGPSP